MPKVSVIISTYNGEAHLQEAIESILQQTYSDFEVIIVNDGSTDATGEILRNFEDARIRILTNERNLGITASQNRAIAAATGEYLALMDHDDISLPHRLQTQVDFLNAHHDIGMLASNSFNINEKNEVLYTASFPTDEVAFKWNTLVLACPNIHTTLMIRRSALEEVGGYGSAYKYAGDYELISNLIRTHRVANLEEPLVKWRAHDKSTSRTHVAKLMGEAMSITRHNVAVILGEDELDDSAWMGLRTLIASPPTKKVNLTGDEVDASVNLLLKLQSRFYQLQRFSPAAVNRHKRYLYRIWGKHFLALVVRRNGQRDFKCRLRLLKWSMRLLLGANSERTKGHPMPAHT
jgi:glycosyltransferase involved in cell wall biosynthesis